MHETLRKFGYPETLVSNFVYWCVVLRPQQVTLGSLVLIAKSDATSFAALPPEAYAELAAVTPAIENGLRSFRHFDRVNYIMLMMVDPQVHFHVLPRYSQPQEYDETVFTDVNWPGPPDLKATVGLEPATRSRLLDDMRGAFARALHH